MLRAWRRDRRRRGRPAPLLNPDGTDNSSPEYVRAYLRGGWVILVGGAVLTALLYLYWR